MSKHDGFTVKNGYVVIIISSRVQILDKEAVEEVKARRDIPDIRPGYLVRMKVVY